jgi:hypothetical protein
VRSLILNKCLDDDFVKLLEPSGRLGFVIPSIQKQWARHFPQGLYLELCEGNVVRVSDSRHHLLALQYQPGQIAVFSHRLRILPSLGWISLEDEEAFGRFRASWESSFGHASRIKKLLRAQGRFIRTATEEDRWVVARMEVPSWQPGSSLLPVDFDCERQIITGFAGNRILVLLRHFNGWHDIERRVVEAVSLQAAFASCLTTVAANLQRLAWQQIRLGLIAAAATPMIPQVVEQIQVGVIASNINTRSKRRWELIDRMQRYPEIRMPVHGWNCKWSPPLKLLIADVADE